MRITKLIIGLIITLVLITPLSPQDDNNNQNDNKYTLKNTVYLALKNNLDIQIQQSTFKSSLESLNVSEAIFIPTFKSEVSISENNTPSNSVFEKSIRKSTGFSLNLSLEQQLALGGTLSASFNNSRDESNSLMSTLNPYLNTRLQFNLTQPLLKNFGTFITKKDIYIAINDLKKAELDLKDKILEIIYNVEDAYWNLVYQHQNLKVKKEELARAEDLLKQNEIKVRVGTSPRIDILDARASKASAESALLRAEKTLQDAEENLKKILNLSKEELTIIPADTPKIRRFKPDLDEFLLEALDNRPDVLKARLDLKNRNIDVRYYRNQMLPNLQLQAQYWTTGWGGIEKIFDRNPFFGGVQIGSFEKDIWKSIEDTIKALYQNYSITLNLEIPLSFKEEKARLTQAKLSLKNALLTLKKTENTVYSEIKSVIKELQSNLEIVKANAVSLELEKQKVNAEEKKFGVGLSTNYEVLQKRKDLSLSQANYLNSIKDYLLTIAKINRYLSRTFKEYDIKFTNYKK